MLRGLVRNVTSTGDWFVNITENKWCRNAFTEGYLILAKYLGFIVFKERLGVQ